MVNLAQTSVSTIDHRDRATIICIVPMNCTCGVSIAIIDPGNFTHVIMHVFTICLVYKMSLHHQE